MSEEVGLDERLDDSEDEQGQKWREVRLEDVSRKRSENVDPQEVDLDMHVGLEHIDPNTPYPEWEPVGGLSSTKRRFEAGDILFAKLRPNLEKSAQPDFEGVASTDIFPIVAEEGINAKYLLYRLSSKPAYDYARRTSAGTRMPRTSWNLFSNFEFDLSPLEEQRRIATVLHNVDQAIQKTKGIIEQTKSVRDGLRQNVFSQGIRPDGRFRNLDGSELKETRIGKIPPSWRFLRLDEVCSDVVDCLNTTPEYSDDGIRVILTSEIEEGRYNPEESPYVSEEVYEDRIRRIEPKPDDVVFTREAPIGEAFKIPEGERLCLGQRTMQLRPEAGVLNSHYLLELLYSEKMQSWYRRVAVGSTTKHMRVEDVEGMKIPVPPIDEQEQIAALLGSYREYVEANMEHSAQLKRLKEGLMQDLLSGTVRTADTNIEVPEEIAQHG
ncbi:hypothetical protein AMS69_03085 [Haloarcula rubripromontorii]|uniref:Type I restriction modification DNA specificity domain-containing protein n=1 Tax=Haloarcula rubripromontorii TaxID=1705562 RepID=A0A0N0U9W9_9EURY|nr:restriction endonuclease subunit S [Haloarcula rubripromontorii]KOX94860.1 hypothetical protein AMS69_03085 [Haloarcula rubripromontorii]